MYLWEKIEYKNPSECLKFIIVSVENSKMKYLNLLVVFIILGVTVSVTLAQDPPPEETTAAADAEETTAAAAGEETTAAADGEETTAAAGETTAAAGGATTAKPAATTKKPAATTKKPAATKKPQCPKKRQCYKNANGMCRTFENACLARNVVNQQNQKIVWKLTNMVDCDLREPNQAKVCKSECTKQKLDACKPKQKIVCAYSKTWKKCRKFRDDCVLKRISCNNPMIKDWRIAKREVCANIPLGSQPQPCKI